MKAIKSKIFTFSLNENNNENIFNTCFRKVFIIIDYNYVFIMFFGKIINKCFKIF